MNQIGKASQWLRSALALLAKHPFVAGVLATFTIALMRVEPVPRNGYYGTHYYRMLLAGCGLFLAHFFFYSVRSRDDLPHSTSEKRSLKRSAGPVGLLRVSLVVACLLGVFNYYQFDGQLLAGTGDPADAAYYYLNSKYFGELGYFELYPAMIVADREQGNRMADLRRYRDLNSYELYPVDAALANAESIRALFSERRWEQFKIDVDFFLSQDVSGGWAYFFADHGYNPPPTWTIVGGTLSRLTPLSYLKVITSIDILLVVLMFAAIGWAFNVDVLLFSLLFFLCTFSGRWPILGQSLLRFDWLAALVGSVCLIRRGRYGLGGGLMAYSALNRILPAIFFWPAFVLTIRQFVEHRRPHKGILLFWGGAANVSLLLLISALVFLGPSAFLDSKQKLVLHASASSYSSHRVGLADALLYRGEQSRDDLNRSGGIDAKAQKVGDLQPYLFGMGAICLLFLALHMATMNTSLWQAIPWLLLPLFCMQTPQIHYYNVRILLIMLHANSPDRLRHRIGLAFLFLIEIATQWSHVVGNWRYTTTCITSVGLCAYFAVMIIAMIGDLWQVAESWLERTRQRRKDGLIHGRTTDPKRTSPW